MPKRPLLILLVALMLCVSIATAQETHQFLGAPREVPDRFTVKHGIRYNTQGYDEPQAKWKKKIRIWRENGVPESIIEQILAFPGSPDATTPPADGTTPPDAAKEPVEPIGQWIDDAFDKTLAQFTACGGSLADRARNVSPADVSVLIMPSAFVEPYYKVLVAGAYYPTPNQIKVLNIYYTWEGPNTGWLRHAKDLLVYEMQNYFGVTCGIQPEPRTAAWPCDAPFVTKPQ